MPFFLAGVAVLLVLLLGGRLVATADPQKLARALRKIAGVALLAMAMFLLARGALPLAIPLALFGLVLLGAPVGGWFGGKGPFGGTSRKSPGQRSEVRTEALEMELDHDTGQMEGRCFKGRFAGRTLTSLSDRELLLLLQDLRAQDSQGALLIEAYLDRRAPGWRDRQAEEAVREPPPAGAQGRMAVEEAYAVLGLGAGASEAEIRAAHRKLMLKLHPDQGGSDYLAARINVAKEVLLGRK
jgi:DnaJ domain